MSLGFPEIAVILLIALLVFGPKRLPEIGRSLGKAVREMRRVARDFSCSVEQIDEEDEKQPYISDHYIEKDR
jgi:sec-independent protein translocase protein TatA